MEATQPKAQESGALLVGPLLVVIPTWETRPSARDWAAMDCAIIADLEGRPDLSHAMVGLLEDRLGTHQAHRDTLVSGSAEWRAQLSSRRKRKIFAEQERARRLSDPIRDHGPSATVVDIARRAQLARDKAKRAGRNRAEANVHLAEAKRLENLATAAQEYEEHRLWLWYATTETNQLALARGEEIDTETVEHVVFERDSHGALVRVRRGPDRGKFKTHRETVTRTVMLSRGGGLRLAFEHGHLGHVKGRRALRLYRIAQRYQLAAEAMDPLRASNPEGGGGGGYGAKGPQVRTVEAGEELEIMRRHLHPVERDVLDLVVGSDMRLRDAAKAIGSSFETTKKHLQAGLECAAAAWAEARKAEEIGQTTLHMLVVDAAVARVRP